jgi:hypothetical protein
MSEADLCMEASESPVPDFVAMLSHPTSINLLSKAQ